jgi:hypothetical protein
MWGGLFCFLVILDIIIDVLIYLFSIYYYDLWLFYFHSILYFIDIDMILMMRRIISQYRLNAAASGNV